MKILRGCHLYFSQCCGVFNGHNGSGSCVLHCGKRWSTLSAFHRTSLLALPKRKSAAQPSPVTKKKCPAPSYQEAQEGGRFSNKVEPAGDGVSSDVRAVPDQLQRRIRSIMIQLVLLSARPYSPLQLCKAVRRSMDEETQKMCSYAQASILAVTSMSQQDAGNLEEIERRRVGHAYVYLHTHCVLQVVKQLTKSDGIPVASVEEWMVYGILLSDPSFRISPLGGKVCYPVLPSTLLAHWSLANHPVFQKEARQLMRLGRSCGTSSESSTPPEREDSRLRKAPMKCTDFVWLSDNCSRKSFWGLAHSLWSSLDAFVDYSTDVHLIESTKEKHLVDTEEPTHQSLPLAPVVPPPGRSSGHPLVDTWLRHFERSHQFCDLLGADPAVVHQLASDTGEVVEEGDGPRRDFDYYGKPSGGIGWNEMYSGHATIFSKWFWDAVQSEKRVAQLGSIAQEHAPLSWQSQYEINTLTIYPLARYGMSVPISVARLGMLVQWKRLQMATTFGYSFLYFLLLGAGNVALTRTSEQLQRWGGKRRSNRIVSEERVNGESGGTSDSSDAQKLFQMVFFRLLPFPDLAADARSKAVNPTEPSPLWRSPPPAKTSLVLAGRTVELMHVEVLNTHQLTPMETMLHLRNVTSASPSDVEWHFSLEEDILCFPILHVIMERRIRCPFGEWRAAARGAGRSAEAINADCTIGMLCRISLWEHEFGMERAAEMMAAYLSFFPEVVRLCPPHPVTKSDAASLHLWTAVFSSSPKEDSVGG